MSLAWSTFPLKMVFQPNKDKKQQQILQKIPNLNLLNSKNWALFETLCSSMPELLLCWVKCSGTRGCSSLKWHGELLWKSVHVPTTNLATVTSCTNLNWCDFVVITELAKLHREDIIAKTWCYSWLSRLFLCLRCQIF